jgi:hypothetical protein
VSSRHKNIQERLRLAIEELPPKKLEQLIDYAEYLKSREEWDATLELMNDPSMRMDVDEGRKQSARREGRNWREVQQRVRG